MTFVLTAFVPHDHQQCQENCRKTAQRICQKAGAKWTPIRERVFELLLETHHPATAYDLMPRLAEQGLRVQPPAVYRALSFLMQHHLVHRIERLNAYVVCQCPETAHQAQFLICESCGVVAETWETVIKEEFETLAQRHNFTVKTVVAEVIGRCTQCQDHVGGSALEN